MFFPNLLFSHPWVFRTWRRPCKLFTIFIFTCDLDYVHLQGHEDAKFHLENPLIVSTFYLDRMKLKIIHLNNYSKNFDISKYTNISNEIVYSPQNEELDKMFAIVGQLVRPLMKVSSVANATELVTRVSKANSFAGVEFPDSYAVRTMKCLVNDWIIIILFTEYHNVAWWSRV